MSTYGEMFDSIRPRVQMFTVDDLDAPPLVEVKVDLTPADGAVALPVGGKGPEGNPGEPAPAIDFQGYVTSVSELPPESILGQPDTGKAWADTGTYSIWLWDGEDWLEIPDALGVPGPVGPPGSISVGTVTTSPTGGAAALEAVGSPLARTVNITLPRGTKGLDGDVGPSGSIRSASDYSNTIAPADGDTLEWDSAISKFRPVTPKRVVGQWTLIDSDFSKTATTAGTLIVATLAIPAQPFKYRFWVTGALVVNAPNTVSSLYAQVYPQSTGLPVARGLRQYGTGLRPCSMRRFSGSKLTPGSTVGEMPADTAQNLNVELVRTGSGSYNVASDPSNGIEVWVVPV